MTIKIEQPESKINTLLSIKGFRSSQISTEPISSYQRGAFLRRFIPSVPPRGSLSFPTEKTEGLCLFPLKQLVRANHRGPRSADYCSSQLWKTSSITTGRCWSHKCVYFLKEVPSLKKTGIKLLSPTPVLPKRVTILSPSSLTLGQT